MPKIFFNFLFLSLITYFGIIARAAEIDFLNNPSRVQVNGEASQGIYSGENITIKYDQTRLKTCDANNRMYQSFVNTYYQFDGGQIYSMNLPVNGAIPATTSLFIPKGTRLLTMWFYNYTIQSPSAPPVCEAYDSDYGKNFNFVIQNP